MLQIKQRDFFIGRIGGGFTFYPYRISLGLSLLYWPCLCAPAIQLHVGPIKIWFYIKLLNIWR